MPPSIGSLTRRSRIGLAAALLWGAVAGAAGGGAVGRASWAVVRTRLPAIDVDEWQVFECSCELEEALHRGWPGDDREPPVFALGAGVRGD